MDYCEKLPEINTKEKMVGELSGGERTTRLFHMPRHLLKKQPIAALDETCRAQVLSVTMKKPKS